ncbi:AsmA family protein, partial [bacterium]|nr:AsmA family protein [bacterium]
LLCIIPVTSPKLKDLALAKAKSALGREVTIERVRIVLLRGIRLDKVTVANKEGFAKEPLFEGKRVVVKYELLPLLHRELVIKKVVLLEPKILLERNRDGVWNFSGIATTEGTEKVSPEGQAYGAGRWESEQVSGETEKRINGSTSQRAISFAPQAYAATKEGKAKKGLTLTISQVVIKKGEVSLEDRSKAALKSLKTGIDLNSSIEVNPAPTSRGGMKEGFTSKGRINLNDLTAQMNPPTKKPLKVSKLEIPYEFKDNLLTIESLKVSTCRGELKAEAKIDLKKTEYDLKTKIEKMEINDLLSFLTTTKDMVYGTLATDLEIKAKGKEKSLMNNAKGKGFINLTEGRISGLPLQKKFLRFLSTLLPIPSLVEIPYNSLRGHFDLTKGEVTTEDFNLNSDLMKISAQGIYSLLGSLDFDITLKTTPKLIKSSDVPVQLRDEEGNASLPFELKGTIQDPKFQPKWEKLIKKAIEKTVGEELEKALGKEEAEAAKEVIKGLGELLKKKKK